MIYLTENCVAWLSWVLLQPYVLRFKISSTTKLFILFNGLHVEDNHTVMDVWILESYYTLKCVTGVDPNARVGYQQIADGWGWGGPLSVFRETRKWLAGEIEMKSLQSRERLF